MATQEYSFTPYDEEEGGWYDRLVLFNRLTQKNTQKPLDNIAAMTEVIEVLSCRCDNPNSFKEQLNKLPFNKLLKELVEIIKAIGFLNPAPKNG